MQILHSIKQNNALSGNGSQIGIVVPNFIGQNYIDIDSDTFYYSTGLTSADWSVVSGGEADSVGSDLYLFYNL